MASMVSMSSVASSVLDDEGDDADTTEMLRILAIKRAEREADIEQRQADLATQAAVIQAELLARQKMEQAQFDREREQAAQERLAYQEYCQVVLPLLLPLPPWPNVG